MTCAATHPVLIVQCERPGDGPKANHERHSAYDEQLPGFIDWPNDDYVKPDPSPATREQKEGRARKKLREMATRTKQSESSTARTYEKFFPTESDRRGRVALYLKKYQGEWVGVDELSMDTVGGSAANRCVLELVNHYGWEIESKTPVGSGLTSFRLIKES